MADVENKVTEAFPPAHPAAPAAASAPAVAPATVDPDVAQDAARDQAIAALQSQVQQMMGMMQELAQAAGLDNLMAQSGASEAAKRVARERIMQSLKPGEKPTRDLVNNTIAAVVKEAKEIAGDNFTGVKNFGAILNESDNLNDTEDDSEVTNDMLAEVTGVNSKLIDYAFRA